MHEYIYKLLPSIRYKLVCANSKDSYQSAHPRSLTRSSGVNKHMHSSHSAFTHVRKKLVHIGQISSNVEIVFSIPEGTALKRNNSLPPGANSFLLEKSLF